MRNLVFDARTQGVEKSWPAVDSVVVGRQDDKWRKMKRRVSKHGKTVRDRSGTKKVYRKSGLRVTAAAPVIKLI